MKTELVSNQYDGTRAPAKRLSAGRVDLDYINSESAAEIDAGIRETIKGLRLSLLDMGLGLSRIKAKAL